MCIHTYLYTQDFMVAHAVWQCVNEAPPGRRDRYCKQTHVYIHIYIYIRVCIYIYIYI